MTALQAQDVVQLSGGFQGFFQGKKLFFICYLFDLMTKILRRFLYRIQTGLYRYQQFSLFDFFGGFEKLAVTADFVAQFVGQFIPIGAVGFIKFALDVGKIDNIAVTV